MKRLNYVIVILMIAIGSFAFTVNIISSEKANSEQANNLKPKKKKLKFKFKHSAGPTQCQNCQCPLGICFQTAISVIDDGVDDEDIYEQNLRSLITDDEYEQAFGVATAEIVDGKLHLEFFRPAALEDGTIPVPEYQFADDVLEKLGYHSISLHQGNYEVTNIGGTKGNNSFYGEVFIDCDVE